MNNEIVARANGLAFTREQLKAAFDRVCDPKNWKMPIDRTIEIDSDTDYILISEAVRFFAGCTPKFQTFGKQVRVTAAGYYASVGV